MRIAYVSPYQGPNAVDPAFDRPKPQHIQRYLSWSTILKKRPAYRKAVRPLRSGARRPLQGEPRSLPHERHRHRAQSFARYIWQFVGGRPIQNAWRRLGQAPAETDVSRAMSRDLLRRGFRFVGPTICYAFMQATGMVNDHSRDCFRWREVTRRAKSRR
jgi:DNA-3-methyladenine glycosylase I